MEVPKSWHLITKMPFPILRHQLPNYLSVAFSSSLGSWDQHRRWLLLRYWQYCWSNSNEDLPRNEEEMQNRQRKLPSIREEVTSRRSTWNLSRTTLQLGIDGRTLVKTKVAWRSTVRVGHVDAVDLIAHQQAVFKSSTFLHMDRKAYWREIATTRWCNVSTAQLGWQERRKTIFKCVKKLANDLWKRRTKNEPRLAVPSCHGRR